MTGSKAFKDIGIFRGAVMAAALVMLGFSVPAKADTVRVTKDTLLDRVQIEDIMVDYYEELMSESKHDVSKYYVDDGVLKANDFTINGKESIRKFFETARDPRYVPSAKSHMLMTNPRISVQGNTATFEAIWTGITSENVMSTPRIIEQGIEHTEFVKQGGQWLIKQRAIISQGGMPMALSTN